MRLHTIIIPVVALGVLVFLTGCEQDEPPVADEPEVTQEPLIEEEEAMPVEPPAMSSLDSAVEMARQDLADRLGSGAEAIRVVDARNVTWRNGALGCPEEDMMYTQALVQGMYILLEFDGERHAYHAGRDGVPFACPAERSQPPRDRDSGPVYE